MGKIIDILETERKRPTAADFDVVHMYKTGQFYTRSRQRRSSYAAQDV